MMVMKMVIAIDMVMVIKSFLPQSVLEVGKESLGFVTLNLPMLDGTSSQVIVQLDGLVGGHRGFVMAGLKTQPDKTD
jgi:hypothetical protein